LETSAIAQLRSQDRSLANGNARCDALSTITIDGYNRSAKTNLSRTLIFTRKSVFRNRKVPGNSGNGSRHNRFNLFKTQCHEGLPTRQEGKWRRSKDVVSVAQCWPKLVTFISIST